MYLKILLIYKGKAEFIKKAHNPKVAGSNPAPAITYQQRLFPSVPKTIQKS